MATHFDDSDLWCKPGLRRDRSATILPGRSTLVKAIAAVAGHGFNHGIREAFGERRIEDTWLPFFCITTDISESKMKVHRFGSLVWRARWL